MIIRQDGGKFLIKQKRFAFLAGLLDGDGSVYIRRNKSSGYQFTFAIYSTSRQLMKWLRLIFGGQFRRLAEEENKKQRYQWYCYSLDTLLNILPYVVLKREQIETAIEFLSMKGIVAPETRNNLYERMCGLNDEFRSVYKLKYTGSVIPSKLDFAYLAGLLDAEGTFSIYKKSNYIGNGKYTSVIKISNTDQRIFDWMADRFAGYMVVSPKGDNRKEGVWFLSGKSRESILLAVLPYLVIKKERAVIVLEWIRHCRKWADSHKDKLIQKIRVLNLRGISPETICQTQCQL